MYQANLPFHPVVQLFPELEPEAFNSLVDDIRKHGLQDPIVIWNGQIVDGRHRYRACMALGIKPQFEELICPEHELSARVLTIGKR